MLENFVVGRVAAFDNITRPLRGLLQKQQQTVMPIVGGDRLIFPKKNVFLCLVFDSYSDARLLNLIFERFKKILKSAFGD